jgi:Uma2 family endonuclease
VKYELDNGALIIMPPPGDSHGAVQGNYLADLKAQGERRGFGKARGEVGIILWRNPDRVVAPEAVFIANSSLPLRLSREGYLETIPDVVVEVRSKNDTQPEVDHKVGDYLKAGVKLVWVADPAKEIVTEYRPGQPPRVYTITDTLTVEDIIPGFQMPVRRVFDM